ncbi:hypothetical protein IZ6_16440 [Terrihabitans soli]|uniref:Uncharacterized protein n=1 Tax=Terrihabitans soli TaxID=708113 RepID=A0A6S6QPI9_9HYPH|nr:hypothetical protein IZ6_16440 [Terrihabitans soli]
MPGNETVEGRDHAFRTRVRRFAGVDIELGLDAISPRPELVHSAPGGERLESRVLRFVHRRLTRS